MAIKHHDYTNKKEIRRIKWIGYDRFKELQNGLNYIRVAKRTELEELNTDLLRGLNNMVCFYRWLWYRSSPVEVVGN